MSVKILIPMALRPYAGNHEALESATGTVKELFAKLTTEYPDVKKHLFSDDGKLRNFVNVYVNDEDIRYLSEGETPLKDGDVVSIVPSVAGGSEPGQNSLSKEEMERYSRHLILPGVGVAGQKKLKQASVLLIGMGGLGSPAALYLAAAGIGRLGLVDFDVVDETNLQRQVLYTVADVGEPKLDAAENRLHALNPYLQIEKFKVRLTSGNALDILSNYDVIADGTDNFPTRYLVNDACVLLGKPNAYGSIFRFEGQASVFATQGGPCYRCLYPEPPPPGLVPSCAEGGVLGVLPGMIGVIQATEAVKLILGIGQTLAGRLLLYDALTMGYRELKLRKDPHCPVCGEQPTVKALIDYEQFCGVGTNGGTALLEDDEISVLDLNNMRNNGSEPFILDVRDPHEFEICHITGSTLIPLGQLPQRLDELDRSKEIYVHCRSGARSAKAVKLLQDAGFSKVKNVKGGILAWAREIDASLPTY